MQIYAYLTFSGNCREAMIFYKECLGGELTFQTIGESPFSSKMPKKMKNAILHSSLTNGDFMLMASDIVGEKGLSSGNSVSLMLACRSEEEAKECYEKLSKDGEQTHPMEQTFWGALLGDLIDKYGNQWLLLFQKK
jgi:PhnB protein